MWPKVLAQLFELLPHITRLIPMADKYFSQRTAAEKANEAALAAMAEGVRGDLGQVTKAHAGLYRQLQEQSAQLSEVSETVRQMQQMLSQQERRLEAAERAASSASLWVKLGSGVIILLLAILLYLVAHR